MSSVANITKLSEVLLNTIMTCNRPTPSYAGRPVMRAANVKQIRLKLRVRERDASIHKSPSPTRYVDFTLHSKDKSLIVP
jgi:hypothetical protein